MVCICVGVPARTQARGWRHSLPYPLEVFHCSPGAKHFLTRLTGQWVPRISRSPLILVLELQTQASCLALTWVPSIQLGSSCLGSKNSHQLSHLLSLRIIFFKNKSKLPRCAQVLLIYYNKSLWSVPKTSIVTDPLYTRSYHCKTSNDLGNRVL